MGNTGTGYISYKNTVSNQPVKLRRHVSRFLGLLEKAGRYLNLSFKMPLVEILISCLSLVGWLSPSLEFLQNKSTPNPRSEEEAESIYDAGHNFLKLYLRLTKLSVRPVRVLSVLFLYFFYLVNLLPARKISHIQAKPHPMFNMHELLNRSQLQQWILRPKYHDTWSKSRSCIGMQKNICFCVS